MDNLHEQLEVWKFAMQLVKAVVTTQVDVLKVFSLQPSA